MSDLSLSSKKLGEVLECLQYLELMTKGKQKGDLISYKKFGRICNEYFRQLISSLINKRVRITNVGQGGTDHAKCWPKLT